MKRAVLTTILLAGTVALASSAATAQERRLRAGAATSNITPPLGELIVGNWTSPPATHVHDELYARCLVLDDGETRVAIVVADNVGIPRRILDEAKRLTHERSGLAVERILIASTHTHSATTARGADGTDRYADTQPLDHYQTFLAGRIADGIRRAINNLEPARIGWGSGSLPQQVFNRRWFMKPGPQLEQPVRRDRQGPDEPAGRQPRPSEARRAHRSRDRVPVDPVRLGPADRAAGQLLAPLRRRRAGGAHLGGLLRGVRATTMAQRHGPAEAGRHAQDDCAAVRRRCCRTARAATSTTSTSVADRSVCPSTCAWSSSPTRWRPKSSERCRPSSTTTRRRSG